MRLLSTLIKRELLENLTSSRYVLTSILCVALCITSIVVMSEDYANRNKRYHLSHNVQGKGNIFDWGDAAITAKPPVPLSLIAKGTEEVIGRPALPQDPVQGVIAYFVTTHLVPLAICVIRDT